jgi:pSer/pThr/pTyr-binding forkhead associated (FHA) protein
MRYHGETQVIPVNKGRVILGRTKPADIVVDDVRLSRRQCAFDFTSGEAVIQDLESACGTYVNGEQVGYGGGRALRAGDVVGMVDLEIEVLAAR